MREGVQKGGTTTTTSYFTGPCEKTAKYLWHSRGTLGDGESRTDNFRCERKLLSLSSSRGWERSLHCSARPFSRRKTELSIHRKIFIGERQSCTKAPRVCINYYLPREYYTNPLKEFFFFFRSRYRIYIRSSAQITLETREPCARVGKIKGNKKV